MTIKGWSWRGWLCDFLSIDAFLFGNPPGTFLLCFPSPISHLPYNAPPLFFLLLFSLLSHSILYVHFFSPLYLNLSLYSRFRAYIKAGPATGWCRVSCWSPGKSIAMIMAINTNIDPSYHHSRFSVNHLLWSSFWYASLSQHSLLFSCSRGCPVVTVEFLIRKPLPASLLLGCLQVCLFNFGLTEYKYIRSLIC